MRCVYTCVLSVLSACWLVVGANHIGAGFGVNFHLPDDGDFKGFKKGELEMLSKGFKLVRFDMKWSQIEKTCGTYNFSMFDSVMDTIIGAGLRPYAILDYSNKCYQGNGDRSLKIDETKTCSTDKCINAYGKWAQTVANHYKEYSRNATFTSTNEPDNSQLGNDPAIADAKMIKLAGNVFRKAGFQFVGGVTEGVDVDYQRQLLEEGVLQYVTAMSTHPYTHHEPESKLDDLHKLRSQINSKGGKHVKLQLDEWGYPFGGYPSSLSAAAQLLPRTWLVCLSFGLNCDVGVFFDWEGVQDNLKPNEMFEAAEAFQNTIGRADSFDKQVDVDGIQEDGHTYAAMFSSASSDKKYLAVWKSGGDTRGDTSSMAGGSAVTVHTGQPNFCWERIDYTGKIIHKKLCADSHGDLQLLGVNAGPSYMIPARTTVNVEEATDI